MGFAKDILEEAGDEEIVGIVIGWYGWSTSSCDPSRIADDRNVPREKIGVVLTWEEAKPFLGYTYDSGYGGAECHAITAWTPTRVLFVAQYDGSTWLDSVPRDPLAHQPSMPGGG